MGVEAPQQEASMSLDLLEKKLVETECDYTRKPDGTILMPCQGRYIIHPVFIEQEQRHLLASVRFPIPMMSDAPELCSACNELLIDIDEITVSLENACRMLYVSVRSTYEDMEESLKALGIIADQLHLILEHVRDCGRWDMYLVRLAFLNPEDCYGTA
jgi:hypothetical protein